MATTTPALEPPPGVAPNFIDPYTRQASLIGTSAACLSLTTIGIVIRIFTKVFVLKQVHSEEYLLIFAGLGFGAFCGVQVALANAGVGRHQWDVAVNGYQRAVLLTNILDITYGPVMFAAKASILVGLKRIFDDTDRGFVQWSFIVLIALNGAFYFATFISFIAACVPRAKITDPTIPGTCIASNGSILATSVCNILSDFAILILPISVVWSLQMPLKMKMTVVVVFATGLFACISSIIRLYYSVKLTLTDDVTYALCYVSLWAIAEFTTVILVGCFPVFPRFFKYVFRTQRPQPHVATSRAGSFARHNGHSQQLRLHQDGASYADRIIGREDYVELTDRRCREI